MCANQFHYMLRLARQWKLPICNACTRWALFQISFRPQQEIEAKLGDGRTIHSGPSFARLRYILIQDRQIINNMKVFMVLKFQALLSSLSRFVWSQFFLHTASLVGQD